MQKLILVQPENTLNETTYAPLGLISLAAYVKDEFDVKIIDLRFESLDYLSEQVGKTRPLVVGFSMLTGSCIKQIIRACKEIKENYPAVRTCVGGIHPTFFPEQTLLNPYIDFVIVNEGEKPLLELLRALEGGYGFSDIKNLGWKSGGKSAAHRTSNKRDSGDKIHINGCAEKFLDMDELPMPAWDLIDVERYVERLSNVPGERVINMYTSRGCPYPCTFCYNLNFNRRRWRARSAERVVEELEVLYNKYKINYVIIHDDNFVVDRKRALEIGERIKKKGLEIKYSMDARIDYFDREFFGKLQESGMCQIRVGCESGSNRVLKDVVQKGITKEQTIKAVEIARDLGLEAILSFVIGWPTETIEERQETIDLILKLQKIHPKIAIYPLWVYIPYPGTPLFDSAVELGFAQPQSLEAWGGYSWGKAHIPWLSNRREYERIHELSPLAWYNKSWSHLSDESPRAIFKFLSAKSFRPLVLFRFKHNFWKLPLDAEFIIWLKKQKQRV